MRIGVFDLFRPGIGPSSSHTVGPMRAARLFALELRAAGLLPRVAALKVVLHGSLGATGRGHGTDRAVVLGLLGETPEEVDAASAPARVAAVEAARSLSLLGEQPVPFRAAEDLSFERRPLPFHPNALRFTAFGPAGEPLHSGVWYSIGGGFVVTEGGVGEERGAELRVPFPFHSGEQLLRHCLEQRLPVSGVMRANERAARPDEEVEAGLQRLWAEMQACVRRGLAAQGILPGGLRVPRRAPLLHRRLCERSEQAEQDPLAALDWVTLWALAVNEENAGGGRVVTAPTNGAAGIVPAVMHYYRHLVPGAEDADLSRFLLTAAAIGALYKENASISGAEVGCQGEVGSACSMAAGALCELLGGTPPQVENAAEIAMEHHLGLTCDPIGGLVQIPCIERNAAAAVQAIHAARLALPGDGRHFVSLDQVIRTMRDTGADMKSKYKETSRGGLAITVEAQELSVGLPEC
ncbi:MAG TPA: L-serine ammonia-lyase [Anaeromyxobacteraceae bacterium]|jgi:L-serine dehydratase|nr:L-serine ammonia-lyase [Anaeromyxobacteraceae bacterium]